MQAIFHDWAIKDAFRAIGGCVSDDPSRPVLWRVCIRVWRDGKVEMTALDQAGAVAAIYYSTAIMSELPDTDKGYHEFIVRPFKVPKGAITVSIDDDSGKDYVIRFGSGGSLRQDFPGGSFPDIRRAVVTDKPSMTIAVNPKLLEKALHAMRGEKVVTLCLYNDVRPIQIDGGRVRTICLPVRQSSGSYNSWMLDFSNRHNSHE